MSTISQRNIDMAAVQEEIGKLAVDLQWARRTAGDPSYRALAKATRYSLSHIWRVLNGEHFPRWAFVEAFLNSCGITGPAGVAPYRAQWMKIAQMINPLRGEEQHHDEEPDHHDPAAPVNEECQKCGALVINPLRHRAWHATYIRRDSSIRRSA